MKSIPGRSALVSFALMLGLAGRLLAVGGGEFTPLFNGQNLDGWFPVLENAQDDPKDTWSVKDGMIICTGRPNGYIRTKDSYKNYVLRLQWRYAYSGDPEKPFILGDANLDSGNSGVLVHGQPPFVVWPRCIEVQLHNATAGSIFPLEGAKSDHRTQVEGKAKPVGQWNQYEITSENGRIRAVLNGELVSEVTGCDPSSGFICLQSEGAEIHFRNVEIKSLD